MWCMCAFVRDWGDLHSLWTMIVSLYSSWPLCEKAQCLRMSSHTLHTSLVAKLYKSSWWHCQQQLVLTWQKQQWSRTRAENSMKCATTFWKDSRPTHLTVATWQHQEESVLEVSRWCEMVWNRQVNTIIMHNHYITSSPAGAVHH